jgi:isopentenyl-diphosphate delta-isomerase
MSETPETVVLLADDGTPIGTAPKATVHTTDTVLHLAFSCHVFDDRGRVLVTRRALDKKTWPGVWTNSFCGHPAPDEPLEQAIVRRAERELGLSLTDVRIALPEFRYRAVDASGIVENEICPVYTARAVGDLDPADDEVSEWAWLVPADLQAAVASAPFAFSPWLGWQLGAWLGDYAPAAPSAG